MKAILFAIATLITLNSSAYDDRTPLKKTCSREACLVSEYNEIGFYSSIDFEGEETLKLNSKASLLDIPTDKYCFKGNPNEVTSIITGLAGITNAQYPQGAHSLILDLDIQLEAQTLDITVEYRSDYSQDDIVEVLSFKACN